jgi:hypothetical protein
MNNLKIKILAVAGGIMLLTAASCKKWINDTPEPLQVDESLVFSTEKGFGQALTGVYLQMGDTALYGRDLSIGVLSLLGRSYDQNIDPSIGDLYYESAKYNLQGDVLKKYTAKVWTKMYQSIANLNNLLDNIEAKKEIFTGNNYNRYKGEALALRAYLHFDLLRLFVDVPTISNGSAPGIPYIKTINPANTPIASIAGVLAQCIDELKIAEGLLDQNDVTNYRINNWAVKGLLARLYLYKGDYENAKKYSNEVIDSRKFKLAVNNADLFFVNENLFNLFTYQAQAFQKSVFADQAKLGLTTANQTALYVTWSGATADWRRSFVDPLTGFGSGSPFMPKKFYPFASKASIPMVRLTEMYYIAAECAVKNTEAVKATALLDTVRVHRNLPKYPVTGVTLENLETEIRYEYQKEFIAEGQMFFYYKRKNIPFASLQFTKVPVDGNASYLFVKPE